MNELKSSVAQNQEREAEMDSLTQDLADLIPVSEKLKKENDEFKLEIESLKQTIEEGENERIQMLRNDILFSFLSVNSHFLGSRPYTVYNWCPSKVHFRANVIAYLLTLARKWTFDGHQLYDI